MYIFIIVLLSIDQFEFLLYWIILFHHTSLSVHLGTALFQGKLQSCTDNVGTAILFTTLKHEWSSKIPVKQS